MKKTVVVEIFLVAIFAILMSCTIITLREVVDMNYYINMANATDPAIIPSPDLVEYTIFLYNYNIPIYLSIGIPALIAAVIDLAAIVIIAVRDLPIVKQKIDACKAKRAEKKESRNALAKQKRINQLQSELDELKKDE